ncbi:MAG: hypothetical protein HON23_02290, partial [Rickettsiales bacterium]|nr:hypothetical protein [Rickettsiales bacterium]
VVVFLILRGGNLGTGALLSSRLQNDQVVVLSEALLSSKGSPLLPLRSSGTKIPSLYSSLLRGISEAIFSLGDIEIDLPIYLANLTAKLNTVLGRDYAKFFQEDSSLFMSSLLQKLSPPLIADIVSAGATELPAELLVNEIISQDPPVSTRGFTMSGLREGRPDVMILAEVMILLGEPTHHPKGVSQNAKGEWMLEYSERGEAEVKTIPVKETTLEQLKSLKLQLENPKEVAAGAAAPVAAGDELDSEFREEEGSRKAARGPKGCCSIM